VRRRLTLTLVLMLVAALAATGRAAALTTPPSVDARAVLVADGATGEVLYARNATAELPIASITKIMTALITIDRTRPGSIVRVAPAAGEVGESSIHLVGGERLSVRDLLEGALIQSANDAADALAAYVGHGSIGRFVALMNHRARRLGLRHTHYVRPDGLDAPGHYSSARDVFRLARLAMHRPIFRQIVRMRTATIAGGRRLHTWNDLLGSYRGTLGVKTGHTGNAGWNEVAAARRKGVTLYAVVLGSPDRAVRNDALVSLLDWAFAQYSRLALVVPGRTYASAALAFTSDRLPLVARAAPSRTVRLDRTLVERVVAPAQLEGPIARGRRLGQVRVYAGGKLVADVPLVAARAVPAVGFRQKLSWYAGRTVDEAGGMLKSLVAAVLP